MLYLGEEELIIFVLLNFRISIFTREVEQRSSLLAKMVINGPAGLWVFPHLLGPNSYIGVTFKFLQSFLMTVILFTPCLGMLGGVAVFHLRNFCGWWNHYYSHVSICRSLEERLDRVLWCHYFWLDSLCWESNWVIVDGSDRQLSLITLENNLPFCSALLIFLVGTMEKSELFLSSAGLQVPRRWEHC